MIGAGELRNRIRAVNPTVRVRVLVPFFYGGRVRDVNERLQITQSEFAMFVQAGTVERAEGRSALFVVERGAGSRGERPRR